jgi:hypothetical protein
VFVGAVVSIKEIETARCTITILCRLTETCLIVSGFVDCCRCCVAILEQSACESGLSLVGVLGYVALSFGSCVRSVV